MAQGIDVVLEIDWQGARQIKMFFQGVVLIFIVPPSLDVLKQRLKHRQQDTPQTIARRMEAAQNEIAHCREFDYLVVNDQFDLALQDLQHVVLSVRLKMTVQVQKQKTLLDHLLNKHYNSVTGSC